MTHPLYDASVPTFLMFLKALSRLIDKAQASGIPEEQIMASRLAPDMHPFPRQIQIATDVAKGAIGRLTQQEEQIHAEMAQRATDHEAVLALDVRLRAVQAERELLEEEWLSAAEVAG